MYKRQRDSDTMSRTNGNGREKEKCGKKFKLVEKRQEQGQERRWMDEIKENINV